MLLNAFLPDDTDPSRPSALSNTVRDGTEADRRLAETIDETYGQLAQPGGVTTSTTRHGMAFYLYSKTQCAPAAQAVQHFIALRHHHQTDLPSLTQALADKAYSVYHLAFTHQAHGPDSDTVRSRERSLDMFRAITTAATLAEAGVSARKADTLTYDHTIEQLLTLAEYGSALGRRYYQARSSKQPSP